jgi:hypothetical protein
MDNSKAAADNALGLDLQNLSIQDELLPVEESVTDKASDGGDAATVSTGDAPGDANKRKPKPYKNVDRHLTGSNPRVRGVHYIRVWSTASHCRRNQVLRNSQRRWHAFGSRMRRSNKDGRFVLILICCLPTNYRIQDVKKDEDAFKKTEEEEKAKQARIRKVQQGVDKAREQNVKRKMDKIQSREWDSGKEPGKAQTRPKESEAQESETTGTPPDPESETGWGRGRGRGRGRGAPRGAPRGDGRGRGRGRGRGGHHSEGSAAATDGAADPPTAGVNNSWGVGASDVNNSWEIPDDTPSATAW